MIITIFPQFFVSEEVTKFLKKKTQLYTLFSVVFFMQRTDKALSKELLNNLQQFVKMYSVFSNDMDLTGQVTDDEKVLFDWLKKYKLASSEGLNKHTNRMIRYNVLKDFLFGLTKELVTATETLYDKMVSTSMEPTEDPGD